MSMMRKKLPQAKSILIFPSDPGIDLKATAEKMMQNKRCVDFLKAVTGLTHEDAMKEEFIEQQSRVAIFSCYAFAKYDSDLIVPNENGVLKYVFEDINMKDLDIIGDNFESLSQIVTALSKKEVDSKALGESLLKIVQDKQLGPMVTKLLTTVLDAKLIKVIGADESVSKADCIKETVENLQVEDMKALYYFTKASISLNVEKKTVLPS